MSGSPTPKLITSTPAARFAAILRSISANRYGGRVSIRFATFTRLPFSPAARRGKHARSSGQPAEDLDDRSGQEHGALGPFDLERPARHAHGDRAPGQPAQTAGDGHGARAGPACQGLADAALPDAHAHLVRRSRPR